MILSKVKERGQHFSKQAGDPSSEKVVLITGFDAGSSPPYMLPEAKNMRAVAVKIIP